MPEEESKICAKCGVEKPIGEFGILRSSGDGHNPLCFDCKRKRDQTSRAKKVNKEKTPDQKRRRGRPKNVSLPKEIVDKHKESGEAQLIRAFKKTTIKSFIKDDLIPMLERTVEEKFK